MITEDIGSRLLGGCSNALRSRMGRRRRFLLAGRLLQNSAEGGCCICRPKPISVKGKGCDVGITLLSDLHIGAADVNYELICQELADAKKRGDRININGDVFDAILPGDRKRFKPETLHKSLQGRSDILNATIEMAEKILAPYADLLDMVGVGNHDTAVEKFHSLDIVAVLIDKLNKHKKDKSHIIHYGGYTGFIDYRIRSADRKPQRNAAMSAWRYVIYYHHGSGGSAPVTKGMINFARLDSFIDADMIWRGHNHNRWAGHTIRMRCPQSGHNPTLDNVRHVNTGSYFPTYSGQSQESIKAIGRRASYASDAGFAPQGNGGARVVITTGEKLQVQVIQ